MEQTNSTLSGNARHTSNTVSVGRLRERAGEGERYTEKGGQS